MRPSMNWARGLLLSTALTAVPAAAQSPGPAAVLLPTDRTVLPIPEPSYPPNTIFDVRNATPPPRFEIKAPAKAPDVLIVLIDDMGFGQSSAFGGPIHMPTVEALANEGFTGKIAQVTIKLKEMKKADREEEGRARTIAALKKGAQ
jgi:hypothetical protein